MTQAEEFLPCDLGKRLRDYDLFPLASDFADAVLGAEVFDFGEVPTSFLTDEAHRGFEPFHERLLRSPFPVCMMRYRLTLSATPAVTVSLALAACDLGQDRIDLAVYDISNDRLFGKLFCTPSTRQSGFMEQKGVALETLKQETRSDLNVYIALLMILNTRGIRLETVEPTKTEQRKRREQGKPPLKRVTRVDVRHFMEAVKNSERGGTHASPVPHRRRGHLRQLPTGKQTWIRDCIVSVRFADEGLAPRTRYQVVHDLPVPLLSAPPPAAAQLAQ
jgi:hypothetical protein